MQIYFTFFCIKMKIASNLKMGLRMCIVLWRKAKSYYDSNGAKNGRVMTTGLQQLVCSFYCVSVNGAKDNIRRRRQNAAVCCILRYEFHALVIFSFMLQVMLQPSLSWSLLHKRIVATFCYLRLVYFRCTASQKMMIVIFRTKPSA